jgi:hypothetical protein
MRFALVRRLHQPRRRASVARKKSAKIPRVKTLPTYPPASPPAKRGQLLNLRKPVDNFAATCWESRRISRAARIFPLVVGRESGRRNWRRLLIRRPAPQAMTVRSNQQRARRESAASDVWIWRVASKEARDGSRGHPKLMGAKAPHQAGRVNVAARGASHRGKRVPRHARRRTQFATTGW